MSKFSLDFVETQMFSRALRTWASAAEDAHSSQLSELRRRTTVARTLKTHLDQLIRAGEDRLALPAIGSSTFVKPFNADWAWRPDLWRSSLGVKGLASVTNKCTLGEEISVFHDCPLAEISLRQCRNLREEDLAPYGLKLDVFEFGGSFLSLAIDLPEIALKGLTRNHIIGLEGLFTIESPIEIFARLNIENGPNTEQLIAEIRSDGSQQLAEFDLAYSNLNEKRIERGWVDLIFDRPKMNQVFIRDITFFRRPRAQL